MNGISSWLRQFSSKLSALLRGFMAGRYGTDRLNMVILCAGLVASLLSVWTQSRGLNLIFFLLSYGLMIWAIFRSLSRNTYKRYLENQIREAFGLEGTPIRLVIRERGDRG